MHRTRFRPDRPAVVLAALVAAAVLVAGCSSDSEPSSSKSKSTTTSASGGGNPTTTRAPIDPSTLKEGPEGYEQALAPLITTYTTGATSNTDKAATCMAPKWVKTIGVSGFADAGYTPADVATAEFNLAQLDLSDKQASALYKAFDSCDIDLRKAALEQVMAQTPTDDDVRACLEDAITDDFVEAGFTTSITGGEVSEKTFAPIQKCLGR